MEQNKTGKYLKYAIGEILLVVIGILIALSINNWNENRKDLLKEQSILKSLQYDLSLDINEIKYELDDKEFMMERYLNCLDILANKKQATKAEFIEEFSTILAVGGVSLNKTTFNNLQTSGQISLIKSKAISDSIVKYYSSDFTGWETASRDYTRNIIAPYLLEFDYIPQTKWARFSEELFKKRTAIDIYEKPEKPLEAYKQNYFIINILRQKIYNTEGQTIEYKKLLKQAENLDDNIQYYMDYK